MIKREDSNSSIGSSSTPPPMLSAYSEAATALYSNVVKRSISPNQEEHMSFISEFVSLTWPPLAYGFRSISQVLSTTPPNQLSEQNAGGPAVSSGGRVDEDGI